MKPILENKILTKLFLSMAISSSVVSCGVINGNDSDLKNHKDYKSYNSRALEEFLFQKLSKAEIEQNKKHVGNNIKADFDEARQYLETNFGINEDFTTQSDICFLDSIATTYSHIIHFNRTPSFEQAQEQATNKFYNCMNIYVDKRTLNNNFNHNGTLYFDLMNRYNNEQVHYTLRNKAVEPEISFAQASEKIKADKTNDLAIKEENRRQKLRNEKHKLNQKYAHEDIQIPDNINSIAELRGFESSYIEETREYRDLKRYINYMNTVSGVGYDGYMYNNLAGLMAERTREFSILAAQLAPQNRSKVSMTAMCGTTFVYKGEQRNHRIYALASPENARNDKYIKDYINFHDREKDAWLAKAILGYSYSKNKSSKGTKPLKWKENMAYPATNGLTWTDAKHTGNKRLPCVLYYYPKAGFKTLDY